MAVTKMEKATLITDKKNQELLLQTVQGLQNVEIRDLFKESDSNQWVGDYFMDIDALDAQSSLQQLEQQLVKINEAIQFVEHYGDSKAKKHRLKRQALSLQELEAVHSEEIFDKELTEILTLKKQWELLEEKNQQLLEEEEQLTIWQSLDLDPNTYQSKETVLKIGRISTTNVEAFKEELLQTGIVGLEEIYYSEKQTALAYVTLRSALSEITAIASKYGFSEEEYPFSGQPKQVLAQVKESLNSLWEERQKLTRKIGEKNEAIHRLQWGEEVALAKIEREKIKERFIHARYLIVLQGWIDVEEKEAFVQTVQEYLEEDQVYLSFDVPTKGEIQEEVPTKLRNHPVVAPFEILTEMYSLPKYEEIDPTPWMTPFYLVFFGMMVADIGYGLVMLIATILVQKLTVLPRGMQRFMKFFEILSIPTIIWGLIYSSFFGQALPKEIFGLKLPFPILSTTEDVNTILILSVVFGLIQIFVGLFVAGKEHIKRKEYLSAVSEGFAWQGILGGIGIAAAGALLLHNSLVTYGGAALAILSALCILAVPIIQSSSKVKGAAKGAYNLYGITGYIGDLVSYTRLMALGISGGSIAAAFNMLVAFMPPAARFSVGILLIIALHALNMFLSLLGAYVHGARLQYVEFFGKFYTGGGRAFDPFRTAEKHVNITENKKHK
ncbi:MULTISPECIES: V-type ATP synthase subunit I [unclassified Enterococcus]|jgi:V/A-type H+-transporting ATPase subunit I|uniref:V-type ATP synthase subunit I n=1 Tax=unclassified Enterococcus TaxID=2608891 RepID=UPI003D26607C